MSAATSWKLMALWLLLVVLAIVNGTVREKILIPAFGERTGMQVSGVTLSIAIFAVCWFAVPLYGAIPLFHYWLIGAAWLLMTLLFEFGFGRFIAHKSWAQLLAAYNITKGNLWLLVLVATFLSPWLAARLSGRN